MIKNKRIMLGLLAIILAFGCEDSSEQTTAEKTKAFASETNGNTLHSPKFGLSIEKPDGWYALGYDELNALIETGGEVASSGNDDLGAILEATEKNNYSLFLISQYETGAPVEVNPNVLGVAENISAAPGIKSGKDYFFHAKKLMAQANPSYVFEDGYKVRLIDGVEFDQMDLTIELAGMSSKQTYYAAKSKNFIIGIIQTYESEDSQEATSKIIDTIKLDW